MQQQHLDQRPRAGVVAERCAERSRERAREIEDVLMRLAGVLDVGVIGVPDAKFTEAVCAVVVKAPGSELTSADVIAHCARHVAGFKRPKHVVFVDHLQRTPSHKMQKFKLRAQYAHLGMGASAPA